MGDAEHVHRALEPVLLLGHASGTLPLTRSRRSPNTNAYVTSKFWLAYSLTLLVAFTALALYAHDRNEATDINIDTGIARIGKEISLSSNIGSCTVFALLTVLRMHQIAGFFECVASVTANLAHIHIKCSVDKIYYIFYVEIVIGILLCVIVTCLTTLFIAKQSIFMQCFAQFVATFVIYVVVSQFIDCLVLLHQRFKVINRRLERTVRLLNAGRECVSDTRHATNS